MYKILNLTHEQWLEERKKGIGSSEVGVIMGLSHYADATPLKLWRLKTGLDAPRPETPAMLRGHMMEDSVVNYFVHRTGALIDPGSRGDFLAVDTQKPYLRVSPDRLFWPAGTPEEDRTTDKAFILECKTTVKEFAKDRMGNWLYPDSWMAQVQYQMHVMGIRKAAICWLVLGRDEDHYVWVDYNPVFCRQMESCLDKFWNENVLKKIAPEEILTDDDAKLRWPMARIGKKAIANSPLLELIARRNKAQEVYTLADKEKKECDRMVRMTIGDTETLLDDAGNVILTYKNGEPHSSFDENSFARDYPEIYAKYCVNVSSRTLRYKPAKPAKA